MPAGLFPWSWVYCTDHRCGHSRAIPFVPWSIRWGADNPADLIRRNFRCSMCGTRGAVFGSPNTLYGTDTIEPFPAEPIRIGGRRMDGESNLGAAARNQADYLRRYPTGDALQAFRGGPPGPASMCGKFTAMASWQEVVAFSQPLTVDRTAGSNDREMAYRVMGNLPVIIWDAEAGKRRVVPMRWGFPSPQDWRRPQPIHARAESIETTRAFAQPFLDGQRGIALMKTFNEAPDVEGPTVQHTITPGEEHGLAAAFVWRRFVVPALPAPLLACVLVTVPANKLIATLPTDRMPAFLDEADWGIWLGEEPATPGAVKACLKTQEGVRWTMAREERKADPKRKRQKPTVSDPGGLV